jgi:BirA family biotin operon repressor/biotin-[acetyl-CoA-carboxylase] ligase
VTPAAPLPQRLFEHLAGAGSTASSRPFQSGEQLAQSLGVSRSAVWKAAAQLRALGLAIDALPRQGYRLRRAAGVLDDHAIRARLSPGTAARLRSGDCVWRTGSTNADLLARSAPTPGEFDFLAAECQSAGRGRRGRRWLAPPGGGLCLSWSWSFDALPPQSGALSLAVGITALRALRSLGIDGVRLKWPNDLVSAGGKLAGILIELKSEAGGPLHVVVGIGLNVALGETLIREVAATGNRAADLASLGAVPDRNVLIAALLESGVQGLAVFAQTGFASFADEYREADALAGREVTVSGGATAATLTGIARGIDADGALRLQTATGVERILSGDVSVRSTSNA